MAERSERDSERRAGLRRHRLAVAAGGARLRDAVAFGRRTVLQVRGRTSGKVIKVPMDPPFAWNGTRCLVSPRGETRWARNLRAAGEADLHTRCGLEHIRVVELGGAERDAVVKAYASGLTCNCRRSMEMLPDPADHPAFRIESTAS